MIVPMKIVTLLAVSDEAEKALKSLRDLGVMQVEAAAETSDGSAVLSEKLHIAEQTATLLERYAGTSAVDKPAAENRGLGQRVLDEAGQCADRLARLNTEAAAAEKRLAELAVWGKFDRQLLDTLRDAGIFIELCQGNEASLAAARSLKGVAVVELPSEKGVARYAVVSDCEFDTSLLPVVTLEPDDDEKLLTGRIGALRGEIVEAETELTSLAAHQSAVRRYVDELAGRLEFSRASDAVAAHGAVVSLRGFVPVPALDKLYAAANANGWGLLVTDPGPDDIVPVLIRENRFSRIIKPLFDFLGVIPGYREIDVSGGVLIFFTIFYAMIIGDAGYGLLFLGVSLWAKHKFGKRPGATLPIKMFMVLSVATVVWGVLNGSWFGLEHIPGTDKKFPGLPLFTGGTEAQNQANMQAFCFLLAVAQLSLGRIWKAIHEGGWRAAGENIGWMLVIWANFFLTVRIIVYPGDFPNFMYWLYGIGLGMVMICGVKWRDPADVFQFPFSIVGSFTDVLSYIRLFAVGMAGTCIAQSFNNMAFDVCRSSLWVLPVGVVIVLFGHVLNIALGFMSVLVHGVRLNTLEFSNHTGLTWSGELFKPFSNHLNEK